MKNRFLLPAYQKKIIHDQKRVLIFLILGAASFEFLYAWIINATGMLKFAESYMKILPPTFRNLLNVQPGTAIFGTQILAFGFSHPFIMIMLSFLPVSMASRYIAGEVENRTFDIFLTKPLQRNLIPGNLFIFLFVTLFLQVCAMLGGMWMAYLYFNLEINFSDYVTIALTAYAFYMSMAAGSIAISSFLSERGKSLAFIIGILITFYFFDSIIRLNESLSFLRKFSYFQLYQPTELIRGLKSAGESIIISGLITVICLMVSLLHFRRRDI